MIVSDVMVAAVRTAQQNDPVRGVAAAICTNKISGLPVVDDDNILVGIISEKDILKALLPTYSDFLDDPVRFRDFQAMEATYAEVLGKSVGELMTPKVVTVAPDDPILMAASKMTLQGFRRVPVADAQNRLVGIVSLGDIHKAIFKRELGIE